MSAQDPADIGKAEVGTQMNQKGIVASAPIVWQPSQLTRPCHAFSVISAPFIVVSTMGWSVDRVDRPIGPCGPWTHLL